MDNTRLFDSKVEIFMSVGAQKQRQEDLRKLFFQNP